MIVVDASVVVELLLNAARAADLRRRLLMPLRALHVPHLIDLEVLHTIRRYWLTGEISDMRASEAIADHLALPLKRHSHHFLLLRAWDLRANFTAYDAIYVALADSLGATLLTADTRLAKAATRFVSVEVP